MAELKNFLPFIMFATGVFNVLVIKWADDIESEGYDGVIRKFQHPFIQTGCMFFGQFLCFIFFELLFKFLRRRRDGSEESNVLTAGNEDFRPTILLAPAIYDLLGSVMIFSGLYFTSAASCQLLRAAVIIFSGLFSVMYLNQTLKTHHWVGTLFLITGLIIIPIQDYYFAQSSDKISSNNILTGDLLILCGTIFHSLQLIYEEKYIKILDISPLRAVGWQGVFGTLTLLVLYFPLNFIKGFAPFNNNSHGVIEDFLDAMAQMANNYRLLIAHGLFIISVAFYNFCGLSITKDASCGDRVAIDMVRVVFIWLLTLMGGLQEFQNLQMLGLIVILVGISIFRNVLFVPMYRRVLMIYSRRRYGDLNDSDEVTSRPADVI